MLPNYRYQKTLTGGWTSESLKATMQGSLRWMPFFGVDTGFMQIRTAKSTSPDSKIEKEKCLAWRN